MSPSQFTTLADYNSWANARLFNAVRQLPDADITKDRPAAFFGSLLGTLNHIFVGDSLWLARIEAQPAPTGWGLDHQPFDDLVELWQARQDLDQRISSRMAAQSPDTLRQMLVYKTSRGEPQETRLDHVLTHLFNHQTHHRGQAHALLSDAGLTPPPLDLIYFLREQGKTGD